MNPILEFRGLIKQYDDKTALDVPELSVEQGRRLGIVGANGSGKTTLLRIAALLDPPTRGEYLFKGVSVLHDKQSGLRWRRKITLLMQRAVLFNTTVAANVAFGLRVRGLDSGETGRRVARALEWLGLAGFETRHARKLSSGEAQRVALARAVALDPEVLLLDEPTSNVDIHHIPLVEDAVVRLQKERGTTVIFTTHQPDQALRLSERIVYLAGGRIVDADMENTFRAEITPQGEGQALVKIAPRFEISAVSQRPGPAFVHIPPSDIILSLTPLASSARNRLRGKVLALKTINPGTVRVTVEVHGIQLNADITPASYKELGLQIGGEICAGFKSTSVKIY